MVAAIPSKDPCMPRFHILVAKRRRHKTTQAGPKLRQSPSLSILCYLACVNMRRTASQSMLATATKADAVLRPARREGRDLLTLRRRVPSEEGKVFQRLCLR